MHAQLGAVSWASCAACGHAREGFSVRSGWLVLGLSHPRGEVGCHWHQATQRVPSIRFPEFSFSAGSTWKHRG